MLLVAQKRFHIISSVLFMCVCVCVCARARMWARQHWYEFCLQSLQLLLWRLCSQMFLQNRVIVPPSVLPEMQHKFAVPSTQNRDKSLRRLQYCVR